MLGNRAVQYAGLTCMPIVGGFLSHALGSAKIPLIGQFVVLTQFTASAFFLAAFAIVLFALLLFAFKDGARRGRAGGGEWLVRRKCLKAEKKHRDARDAVGRI